MGPLFNFAWEIKRGHVSPEERALEYVRENSNLRPDSRVADGRVQAPARWLATRASGIPSSRAV